MARLIRAILIWLLFIALVAAAYMYGRNYVRDHPQDVPWTELRLTDPVGAFTLRKLVALTQDARSCRMLLDQARSPSIAAPSRRAGADCGYDDGTLLQSPGAGLSWLPQSPVTSCPVAAALLVWERQVLQPAARRHFASPVRTVHHAGSYSCRRIYNRSEGPFSEHATADAFDVTGFTLANGRKVTVLGDWRRGGMEAAFLREVRDGACRLFSTTLSPDYNAAHADHLHFDMARRGGSGFAVCR